jgi:hypothetical protein
MRRQLSGASSFARSPGVPATSPPRIDKPVRRDWFDAICACLGSAQGGSIYHPGNLLTSKGAPRTRTRECRVQVRDVNHCPIEAERLL